MKVVLIGGSATKKMSEIITGEYDYVELAIYANLKDFYVAANNRTLTIDRMILLEDALDAGVTERTLTSFDNYLTKHHPALRFVTLVKNEQLAEKLANIFVSPNTCHICKQTIKPSMIKEMTIGEIKTVKQKYGYEQKNKEQSEIISEYVDDITKVGEEDIVEPDVINTQDVLNPANIQEVQSEQPTTQTQPNQATPQANPTGKKKFSLFGRGKEKKLSKKQQRVADQQKRMAEMQKQKELLEQQANQQNQDSEFADFMSGLSEEEKAQIRLAQQNNQGVIPPMPIGVQPTKQEDFQEDIAEDLGEPTTGVQAEVPPSQPTPPTTPVAPPSRKKGKDKKQAKQKRGFFGFGRKKSKNQAEETKFVPVDDGDTPYAKNQPEQEEDENGDVFEVFDNFPTSEEQEEVNFEMFDADEGLGIGVTTDMRSEQPSNQSVFEEEEPTDTLAQLSNFDDEEDDWEFDKNQSEGSQETEEWGTSEAQASQETLESEENILDDYHDDTNERFDIDFGDDDDELEPSESVESEKDDFTNNEPLSNANTKVSTTFEEEPITQPSKAMDFEETESLPEITQVKKSMDTSFLDEDSNNDFSYSEKMNIPEEEPPVAQPTIAKPLVDRPNPTLSIVGGNEEIPQSTEDLTAPIAQVHEYKQRIAKLGEGIKIDDGFNKDRYLKEEAKPQINKKAQPVVQKPQVGLNLEVSGGTNNSNETYLSVPSTAEIASDLETKKRRLQELKENATQGVAPRRIANTDVEKPYIPQVEIISSDRAPIPETENLNELHKQYQESQIKERVVEKVVEVPVEVPVEKIVERKIEVPVEKVVEVEKIIETVVERTIDSDGRHRQYRNNVRTIIFTGDRKTGVTRSALNAAAYYARTGKTLYIDFDLERCGSLLYLGIEEIANETDNVQNGLSNYNSPQMIKHLVHQFAKGDFDCLINVYGEGYTDEHLNTIQKNIEAQRNYNTIIIDCPIENLDKLRDVVLHSEIVICVEPNVPSLINTVIALGNQPEDDEDYIISLFNHSQFYLAKSSKEDDFLEALDYVSELFSLDSERFNWSLLKLMGNIKTFGKALAKL